MTALTIQTTNSIIKSINRHDIANTNYKFNNKKDTDMTLTIQTTNQYLFWSTGIVCKINPEPL